MSRATTEALFVFRLPSMTLLGTEIRSVAVRRALSAEFLGTLLLTFFTVGMIIVSAGMLGEKLSSSRLLVVAMAHGLAFGLLVFAMGSMSAGHLNPIMTLAAVVMRQMTVMRGVMYMAAQLLGAIIGAVLLKVALPVGASMPLGMPTVGPKVTAEGALVVEGILAFTLAMMFLASMGKASAPAVLGLMTALGRLFGTTLTGAPMNPAFVFAVAMTTGMWGGQWVWWLGPMLGAGLAAMCWRSWFAKMEAGRHNNSDRAWR
jgi:glycerol uptake facilitator-like aquaporin